MTAVIYNFTRAAETDTADDAAERLFSALGRYTSAELLELLYVGEEPGFFELMRGLYTLSDEDRAALQEFLASSGGRRTTVKTDRDRSCVLTHGSAQDVKPEGARISLVRPQDPA